MTEKNFESIDEKEQLQKKSKSVIVQIVSSILMAIIASLMSSIEFISGMKVNFDYRILIVFAILFASLIIGYFIIKFLRKKYISRLPFISLEKELINTYLTSIDRSIFNPEFEKGE